MDCPLIGKDAKDGNPASRHFQVGTIGSLPEDVIMDEKDRKLTSFLFGFAFLYSL